jgi:proline iminopeptidase
VKLATRRIGSGSILVCHPGGPGFSGDELGALGGLDATRELVLVDPRGAGATGAADSYALADYVADLEELREELALETIDVLGFSHGGIVAMAYAARHPAHVRKLVLASTLAAFTPEQAAEAARIVESKIGAPWFAAAQAALGQEERGEYETPEEAASMWNAMAPLYFARWDEGYRPAVEVDRLDPVPLKLFNAQPFDLRPDLPEIDAETLVITGADDFICGPAAADAIAGGIPGAEVVILADAGHFTFLEQPEAFRVAVESFLAR